MSLLNYFGKSNTAFKPYISPWKFTLNQKCESIARSFQVGDVVCSHDIIITNEAGDTNFTYGSRILSIITSKQTAMHMLEVTNSDIEKQITDIQKTAIPIDREYYRRTVPILRYTLPESIDGLYYEISIQTVFRSLTTIVASHEISKGCLALTMDPTNTHYICRHTINSMFYHQDKRCEIMEDMINQLVADVQRLQTQLEQAQQSNEIKLKQLSFKEILEVDIPVATIITKC